MLKRAVKKQIDKKLQDWGGSEKKTASNNFEFFKEYQILIATTWFVLIIIIIACVTYFFNTPTSKDYCQNWDFSSSYYDNDCWKEEKICKWSDGRYYDKPINSYCDWSKTSQWWTCNNLYTAKSEWDRKQDHSSRYCECKSSRVQCSSFDDSQIDLMQIKAQEQQGYLNNMYIDKYSQASVNQYNSQVQYVNDLIWKRNRYMSENCTCT